MTRGDDGKARSLRLDLDHTESIRKRREKEDVGHLVEPSSLASRHGADKMDAGIVQDVLGHLHFTGSHQPEFHRPVLQ